MNNQLNAQDILRAYNRVQSAMNELLTSLDNLINTIPTSEMREEVSVISIDANDLKDRLKAAAGLSWRGVNYDKD